MTKGLVFFGILVVHSIAQFLTWSYAERNTAARMVWNVLATPLFHASGSLATRYFWAVATLNSIIWAAMLTLLIARYALKR